MREREAGTIEALLVTPIRPNRADDRQDDPEPVHRVPRFGLHFFRRVCNVRCAIPRQSSFILGFGPAVCDRKSRAGLGNLFRFPESGAGEPIGILDEYRRDVRERFYIPGLLPAIYSAIARLHHAHDFFPADRERHHHQRSWINDLWTRVLILTVLTVIIFLYWCTILSDKI